MTKVKMKAVDTLHVTSAGPDNIEPNGTFEVNETEAKQLEDRGLAVRVGAKAEKAAPANKAEKAAPANKSRIIGAGGVPTPPSRSVTTKKGE